MLASDKPEKIGPAALAPAQIGGVINEPGKVGVLEVDTNREDVAPPSLVLDDATREVRPPPAAIRP
jgi:hypothetical protein